MTCRFKYKRDRHESRRGRELVGREQDKRRSWEGNIIRHILYMCENVIRKPIILYN
jgi:hypothetical protein